MFHQPPSNSYVHKAQRGILSEVVFGNPQHDCSSMGVCKVHIGPQPIEGTKTLKTSVCSCKKAIAFFRAEHNDSVLIHFLNYSLSASKKERFFPEDHFVVQCPFPLPNPLKLALDLEGKDIFIQPGRYPATNDGIYLTVNVKINPNK